MHLCIFIKIQIDQCTGTTVCRIYQCFTIHEMGKQRKINRYAMPAASLLLKSVCIIPFVYVCLSICLYIKPPPLVLFLWTVLLLLLALWFVQCISGRFCFCSGRFFDMGATNTYLTCGIVRVYAITLYVVTISAEIFMCTLLYFTEISWSKWNIHTADFAPFERNKMQIASFIVDNDS